MRRSLLTVFAPTLLAGCAPERDCTTAVWYLDPSLPASAQVSLVGDFNGWNADSDPMTLVDGGWRTEVSLPAGDYRYAIRVDGVDRADPFAPLQSRDPVTGELRSILRVEDCAVGMLELGSASATPTGDLSIEARFLRGEARLDRSSVRATLDGDPIEVDVGSRARLRIEASGVEPGKHTVILSASDRDGAPATPLRIPLWVEPEPFSWDGAIIYQVVLDRFAGADGPVAPGEDPAARFGGSLAGLTRTLEEGYFDDLGVEALWISPLYRNPEGRWPGSDGRSYTSYHGYWPISPDEVEPRFGTEEDVRALVASAHARGIRVLLDVVPNHVHQDHPYRTDERYAHWFHENPDCICGDYGCPWGQWIQTCWFTPYLPDLAWENPEVARTLVADTVGWATRFDLDGFRVDAVPMMRREAIRELVWGIRRELEQGPTPFFLVGETFTGQDGFDSIAANLGPFGLDGQFEFPILWAARGLLNHGADASTLEEVIAASEARWAGSGSVMSPFVGNHDMTRFLTDASGDDPGRPWDAPPPQPTDPLPYRRLVMAQALVLSLPGAPVIYYGDEIGLAGGNDPDNRRAMPFEWSEDQRWTRERVARLGQTRRCSEVLRKGTREPVLAEGPIYAMRRALGQEQALLVLNASDTERLVRLPELEGRWWDAVERQGDLDPAALPVAAWSARLLLPTDPCTERTDR